MPYKTAERRRESLEEPERKDAKKVWQQAYYLRNREKILARQKAAREANPEKQKKQNAYSLKWQRENPEKRKKISQRSSLKYLYGLTESQRINLLAMQDNKCAICKREELTAPRKRFCVDHSHKNGMIRGMLCDDCNRGLGSFLDNVESLRAAISYLEKHNG